MAGEPAHAATAPSPGAPVFEFLASSVPLAPGLGEFRAALAADRNDDIRQLHGHGFDFRARDRGLVRDANWFGEAVGVPIDVFRGGDFRVREVDSVLLNDSAYSPGSTTICSLSRGLFEPSTKNFRLTSSDLSNLAQLDPLYAMDPQGRCCYAPSLFGLPYHNVSILPVCGTGFHNYGHFLYDGLPWAFLLLGQLETERTFLAGGPLAPWQHALLRLAGLLDRYIVLRRPARFRRVIASSTMSFHVPYPSRFVRPLIDTIRFRVALSGGSRSSKIFVSRRFDRVKRLLVNRDAVEQIFARHGFEIVRPEELDVVEQIAKFSAARVVAGETGAGMANIVFCDPGARILEIQPVTFVEGWTRASCLLFGHDWSAYFARAEPRPPPSEEGVTPLRFEVDLASLEQAIRRVQER